MNLINYIVQGINQLKLTDIIILILVVFAIIDFHWHIKKPKNTDNEDAAALNKKEIQGKKVFLTWDYKLKKPILYIQIQDEYLLISLAKDEAATLLEQLKSFQQDDNEKDKINVLDPKAKRKVKPNNEKLKKEEITIPVSLYKKYQRNEVKLEKLEKFIKQNKKPEK